MSHVRLSVTLGTDSRLLTHTALLFNRAAHSHPLRPRLVCCCRRCRCCCCNPLIRSRETNPSLLNPPSQEGELLSDSTIHSVDHLRLGTPCRASLRSRATTQDGGSPSALETRSVPSPASLSGHAEQGTGNHYATRHADHALSHSAQGEVEDITEADIICKSLPSTPPRAPLARLCSGTGRSSAREKRQGSTSGTR